jgi:Ni2+-binding GTPase involved in maturation of urease and hydrogenase
MLARAITLVESTRREHEALAQRMLQALLPATGRALRLGVTGVPGVGKSTTIDQLGMNLIAAGHRLAVLAVDPTRGARAARSSATRRAWAVSPGGERLHPPVADLGYARRRDAQDARDHGARRGRRL